MEVFDNIWDNINLIFNEQETKLEWIKWIHEGKIIKSDCRAPCAVCLILDDCYFVNLPTKMPKQPLHPFCHCTKEIIEQPIPNKTAKAECDINKFTGYIFNDEYNKKTGKKKLFENWGYDIMHSAMLKDEFEKQSIKKYCNGEYVLGKLDKEGQRISITIELNNLYTLEIIKFKSGWMIRKNGLITCNTPFGGNI